MVVDVSAELPREDVEVKIIEVHKAVVYRVGLFLDAPLRLDSGAAKVAQLHLNSERDKPGLEAGANPVKLGPDDRGMKQASGGPDGVFDVVDEIVFLAGHSPEALPDDQINDVGVCVYHTQRGDKAWATLEVPFGGAQMLQLEAISLMDCFVELIEKDLLYDQGEIVIDKGFGLGVGEELLYGRPGAVKLVLKIVVADGVGVIMAHNEVSLGGCD